MAREVSEVKSDSMSFEKYEIVLKAFRLKWYLKELIAES